jgi:tetratricopeptide (TPR) repeat protein
LAGEAEAAYRYSMQAGDEAVAVFAVEDAIVHYEQARALLQEQRRLLAVLPASEVEHLYVYLGRAYAFQNAWQQAQQASEEPLAYHLPTLGSRALNRLAILAVQQSKDRPQVQALLEDAWRMAQTCHDQRALAETEWNLAQITMFGWDDPKGAQPHGAQALSLARASNDQELEVRSLFLLGWIHVRGGDFEEGMRCLEASLAVYALLGSEQTASRELPLPSFAIGAPLTQSSTNRASEAVCWAFLAFAQVDAGQVLGSMCSGRRALALAQEIKNVWAQVISTIALTYGLLDAGAYEEALVLTQHTMALARTLPSMQTFEAFLHALGSTYHVVQQWEEARSTLAEADALAEALDWRSWRVPTLSQLCMNCAVAGQWGQAHTYALKAIALRKSFDTDLIPLDFSPKYETEALLRAGDEREAREAVHRLGERRGPNQRFHIPYLRSLAVQAAWEGHSEQAIGHLREATQIAVDLGLPAEQWQIQAALGTLYEAGERKRKRAPRLLRRQGSSRGWQKASETRHCGRAFWPGRRFNWCCSKPNTRPFYR